MLNSVKPVELIQRMLQLAGPADEDALIVDFFGGSAPTAHAVLRQNQQDGGKRRFISIQIAEPLPNPEPDMATIFDMGRQRIRNVIDEIGGQDPTATPGFRVLKIDSSNRQDVYYTPDQTGQMEMNKLVDNIKPDRGPEDLLFQVLLDWGVDLTLPITRETLAGKQLLFVDHDALAACFDRGIDEALVREIATRQPLRVVFRDAGFENDSMKINVEQLFKTLSPNTEVRSI